MNATATANTPRPAPRPSAGTIIDSAALVILVLAMCSQLDLAALGKSTAALGFATKQLKVALPDIALPLVFLWFIIRTTALGAWRRLWWPPLACWALIFAMIVAVIHSQPILTAIADNTDGGHGLKGLVKHFITKESKEAIAETLQFTAYFIFAPWLFVNLMHDRRSGTLVLRRRLALIAFAAATLIATLLAALQVFMGQTAPAALFSSANIYAGFLAIALPLLCARFLQEWRQVHQPVVYVLVMLLLGLTTMISVWAVAALFIGIIVTGWLLITPTRLAMLVAVMTLATYFAWTLPGPLKPNRDDSLRVNSAASPKDFKKQFIEWYAALNWSNAQLPVAGAEGEHLKAFATGVGPGNYQGNIGPYYGSLPNEEKMPPDSNNLFLVQAVSLGFLGLGALVWVLLHFAHQARLAVRRFPDDWLGAGVLGSLAAFVFVNMFHAMIVRGTGIVLAFVLSLAIIALQREDLELDAPV